MQTCSDAIHANERNTTAARKAECAVKSMFWWCSLRERAWRLEPAVEQLVVHYACDGWLLHASSDDAQRQLAAAKAAAEAAARSEHEVCEGCCCRDGALSIDKCLAAA